MLAMPVLDCPFEAQASPFAAEADVACLAWAERRGLFEAAEPAGYRATRVGWLAAYTTPHSDRIGLQLIADWMLWILIFDDVYCDEHEPVTRPDAMVRRVVSLLGILEGAGTRPAKPAEDPFGAALADIMARLAARATGVQRARFVAAVRGYLLAQCWEAVNRTAGTTPPLDEYVHMRRHSSGVPTCTALIDVAGGYAVSATEFDRPDVTALTDMAVNMACWANDVYSFPKEARDGRPLHSLPAVLGARQPLTVQEMLDASGRMHNREVHGYLAAEVESRLAAGPELCRYLDGLRLWVAGHLRWTRETERYAV